MAQDIHKEHLSLSACQQMGLWLQHALKPEAVCCRFTTWWTPHALRLPQPRPSAARTLQPCLCRPARPCAAGEGSVVGQAGIGRHALCCQEENINALCSQEDVLSKVVSHRLRLDGGVICSQAAPTATHKTGATLCWGCQSIPFCHPKTLLAFACCCPACRLPSDAVQPRQQSLSVSHTFSLELSTRDASPHSMVSVRLLGPFTARQEPCL